MESCEVWPHIIWTVGRVETTRFFTENLKNMEMSSVDQYK